MWEEVTFGTDGLPTRTTATALYRRSLYTFWRRIAAPTAFFDTATRQTCSVKPARTNTPLHALATLNDPAYVEAARVLAEAAIHAEPSADGRIAFAVTRVLGRPPTPAEAAVLRAAFTRLRWQYGTDPTAAAALLAVGESPRDARIPAATHAALAGVCGVVLNLDEAVTKE